jgi:hypothetical protein
MNKANVDASVLLSVAIHPEHPDPEAEICGCGNLEYKD